MSVMRQPRHRRPSFMRDAHTYRLHLEANGERMQPSEPIDPNQEGFCYKISHFAAWKLSPEIRKELPEDFVNVVDDWSYAGAAVRTSLDRISALESTSMERGWPQKALPTLSRTTSDATSLDFDSPPSVAISPTGACFGTPDESSDDQLTPLPAAAMRPAYAGNNSAVADSPLCAAGDKTLGPGAIVDSFDLIDMPHMPTSSAESAYTSASTRTSSAFDLQAWERYLDEYHREIEGVQREDVPRFRHLGHIVDINLLALQKDKPDLNLAAFAGWWKVMLAKGAKVQHEADKVALPTLEAVQEKRKSFGLDV